MKLIRTLVLLGIFGISGVSAAESYSNVVINGQRLTIQQLLGLQQQLGYGVAPGNYLYNAYSQCWTNLTTGQAGCLGGGYRVSGSGSGEWDGQGNWSSWSDYGGGVGGTADGCVYTANWSNC